MRYLLMTALVLLASPASAITYQFETLTGSASAGVRFDARLELSTDAPFFVDVVAQDGLTPVINTSSNFESLDLSFDDNGDGSDIVVTPLSFSSSAPFDDFTLTENSFEYLGFFSTVGGGSSGGLTDIWNLAFNSDQFFFETRELSGRFVAVVSEPASAALALAGLAMIAGFARRRSLTGQA